jgi:hypothetical protein
MGFTSAAQTGTTTLVVGQGKNRLPIIQQMDPGDSKTF